jgi:hypothetical protein
MVDGYAGAELALDGGGSYVASAGIAGIASQPLNVTVIDDGGSGPDLDPSPIGDSGDGGLSGLVLALAIGLPSAGVVAAGAAAALMLVRRRRREPGVAPAAPPAVEEMAEPLPPPVLRIEGDTRRVYVKGVEAKPPLSNEQFRLLHYLYERSGKVISREELIGHVWPDDHAEGVSEEALDALVRRVRERIVQAGGERTYIVTLRGQGFRLEI